jgi:hypothetical protein
MGDMAQGWLQNADLSCEGSIATLPMPVIVPVVH